MLAPNPARKMQASGSERPHFRGIEDTQLSFVVPICALIFTHTYIHMYVYTYTLIYNFLIGHWGWKDDGSAVKDTCCSCKRHGLSFQHLRDSSQPSDISDPGDATTSSDTTDAVHTWCTCTDASKAPMDITFLKGK